MGCVRNITAIMMGYVLITTLLEIGYSSYEAAVWMESPSRYYVTCLHPNQLNRDNIQVCKQFTLLTQQYRKSLYHNISNQKQPPPNYSQTDPYSTPNQTCQVEYGFAYIEQALITPSLKISAVVFQGLSIFIMVVLTIREYALYLPKCACVRVLLGCATPSFLAMFAVDLMIVPFLCLMSISFTEQCIQSNFMIGIVRNVGFWFITPYIAFVTAPLTFFCILKGAGGPCCLVLLVIAVLGFLAIIGIGMISLLLSSPLPILVPLEIKLLLQLLLNFVPAFKRQVASIEDQYENRCLCDQRKPQSAMNQTIQQIQKPQSPKKAKKVPKLTQPPQIPQNSSQQQLKNPTTTTNK